MWWKYFALGLATTALCFGLLYVGDALGRSLPQPPRFVYHLLGWMPWLVGLLLLALKLRGRREIRLGAYAFGAVLPFVVFGGWILSHAAVSNWWYQERFEPPRWRAPTDTAEVFWPTRLRMIDDLLAQRVLRGLPRDSVRALLGPPDRETQHPVPTMRYYLGPERDWIRIDSEELVIRFDSAGYVVDAGTARD